MQETINPHQLKRFIRHLCNVTNHYYEREQAAKSLHSHIKKIRKSPKIEEDLSLLNKKINLLLDKESRVAQLGINKKVPPKVAKRMGILEKQLEILKEERNNLWDENDFLKHALDSLDKIKDTAEDVKETTQKTDQRIAEIEKKVDEKHKGFVIKELKEKIDLLESSYKDLEKNRSVHPGRLFRIKEKIDEYKEKLKKIKT